MHKDKYDYSLVDYKGTDFKVKIICKNHGIFEQKCSKHLLNQGCPICSESKLEKEIRLELIKNNINFISQYGKKGDKIYLEGQKLDFYLPDFNLAIECQGDQHFIPVDFGNKGEDHSQLNFKLNCLRDLKKLNKCKEEKIRIIYYSKYILENGYIGEIYNDKQKIINIIKNENRF